jgi:Fe-S cluster assembly protein SufD
LDETSLFYLRSRGIPRIEAEQLLQTAFIAELFEEYDETLRDTLMARITSAMQAGSK